MVVPLISTLSISNEPPLIRPVVVIVLEPVSIVPNPEVIVPPSKAPTDVIWVCAASIFNVFVERVIPVPATRAVLEMAIAALAFTSASTTTPDPIAATPALEIVTSPLIALFSYLESLLS